MVFCARQDCSRLRTGETDSEAAERRCLAVSALRALALDYDVCDHDILKGSILLEVNFCRLRMKHRLGDACRRLLTSSTRRFICSFTELHHSRCLLSRDMQLGQEKVRSALSCYTSRLLKWGRRTFCKRRVASPVWNSFDLIELTPCKASATRQLPLHPALQSNCRYSSPFLKDLMSRGQTMQSSK